MQLVRNLYNLFQAKAKETRVSHLCIGLRYTAVMTDDGGTGIAYTYVSGSHCGSKNPSAHRDYEGESAAELLAMIQDPEPLNRSMALALINALNHDAASRFPDDSSDRIWMDSLKIGHETRVATVGFFKPLMKGFADRGAQVEVLDDLQGIGDRSRFYEKLKGWAEVLLLTSTSILNDSTEAMIDRLAPGVKVIMLGPSTPMVPEAFGHLPVQVLAGTVPVDKEAVLKSIRHGAGTPVIHRFSRKVRATLGENKPLGD